MWHRQGISIKSRVASILSNFSFPSKGGIRALDTQCHTPTHHLPETFPHQTTLFILVPIYSSILSGKCGFVLWQQLYFPRHSTQLYEYHGIISLHKSASNTICCLCLAPCATHRKQFGKKSVLGCEESSERSGGAMSYDQHRSVVALCVTVCVLTASFSSKGDELCHGLTHLPSHWSTQPFQVL